MGRAVVIGGVAELALVSGVSSGTVDQVAASELAVVSGVSSASVPVTGPTDSPLLTGPQRIGDGSGPSLVAWAIDGEGTHALYSTMTVVAPTETDGDLCIIQFKLVKGKNSAVFDWSAPEQHAPHSAIGLVTEPGMRGVYCDLYWRWNDGETVSTFELVGLGVVLVPDFGDPPSNSGG